MIMLTPTQAFPFHDNADPYALTFHVHDNAEPYHDIPFDPTSILIYLFTMPRSEISFSSLWVPFDPTSILRYSETDHAMFFIQMNGVIIL
jgi:hypothetical protein